ncbi:nucleotidyl transferase AbiEii/AbiGii toxin family protein [Candidatus Aerophobetes bacterium]|nr:nucleotidyl transferase AbiEii/AbiGii toxin family protein [Candidatus Aerophobetes bacterium]
MLKGKRIITNNQRRILTFFPSLSDSQFFYLTGGTALSEFYIGHRLSYDLDLFTGEKEFILLFSRLMEEKLKSRNFTTTSFSCFS